MAYVPSLGRYDLGLLVTSLLLLVFAYVIYPTHIVQVSVWFVIFTLSLAWMAYFLHKWLFME